MNAHTLHKHFIKSSQFNSNQTTLRHKLSTSVNCETFAKLISIHKHSRCDDSFQNISINKRLQYTTMRYIDRCNGEKNGSSNIYEKKHFLLFSNSVHKSINKNTGHVHSASFILIIKNGFTIFNLKFILVFVYVQVFD